MAPKLPEGKGLTRLALEVLAQDITLERRAFLVELGSSAIHYVTGLAKENNLNFVEISCLVEALHSSFFTVLAREVEQQLNKEGPNAQA